MKKNYKEFLGEISSFLATTRYQQKEDFVNKILFVLLFGLFAITPEIATGNEYILYVRPGSRLGSELRTYWNKVKRDSDISHSAITTYPPHCSLTGFFPKNKSKSAYVQAVKDAMDSLQDKSKRITVVGLVQGTETQALDYIKLSSSYLLAVTKAFMKNASVPSSYLKDPLSFPYHITLRNHVFVQNVAKKMKKIQSLERKIQLRAKASWSLFLYERDASGHLSIVDEFPL